MQKHTVELTSQKTSAKFTLDFLEEPTGKVQARFTDRVVLKPIIDMTDYTCRAVIDWIDLEFATDQPTQWRWIQHWIEKATGRRFHVKGSKLADETEYRIFKVRFQEPAMNTLMAAEQEIRSQRGLQAGATIAGLEISVDFRPKVVSEEALAKMYGVLVRSHLPSRDVITEPKDRPRFSWGGKEETRSVLPSDRENPERNDKLVLTTRLDAAAVLDSTYYAGARGSRSSWRIMMKRIDQQNRRSGTRLDLPDDEHRVRIEVTLDQHELEAIGLTALKNLAAFPFQTFQGRYFQFRLPTFADLATMAAGAQRAAKEPHENERRKKFLNTGVVGLKAMDDAFERQKAGSQKEMKRVLGRPLSPRKRTGTGSSSTLMLYKELNSKLVQALRHLGERVRSAAASS